MRKAVGLMLLLLCLVMQVTAGAESEIERLMDSMTLHEKVCQLFIVKPEAILRGADPTKAGAALERGLKRYPVGGLVYFASHLKTPAQTREMIGKAQAFSGKAGQGIGLFLAVDEEGGSVSRFASRLGTTKAPPAAQMDEPAAYEAGLAIGQDLNDYGINLNLAPVADLDFPGISALGSRSFGGDPEKTGRRVAAFARGLLQAGVQPALKHFPGIGSARGNTHLRPARSTRTMEELREAEMLPFQAGISAGARIVMAGHAHFPEIDKQAPASLSAKIITGLLREELGFPGLVMTDALNMKPITRDHSSGEAAVRAVLAGNDLLLMPANLTNAVKGVMKALDTGRISEGRIDESLRRILELKQEMNLLP